MEGSGFELDSWICALLRLLELGSFRLRPRQSKIAIRKSDYIPNLFNNSCANNSYAAVAGLCAS